MKIKIFVLLIVCLSTSFSSTAQNGEKFTKAFDNINQSVLKAQLSIIASDWTEGREAGEKGELLASDYIASMLQLYGVKPFGDIGPANGLASLKTKPERTWFQNFILIKHTPGDCEEMKIMTTESGTFKTSILVRNIDFKINPLNQDLEVEAPVVFVGYGFKSEKLRHDDFSKLNLKGKFLLRISGTPGIAAKELSQQELSAALQESEKIAREMGALGIIEINNSPTLVGTKPASHIPDPAPAEKGPFYGREWADYSLPDKSATEKFLFVNVTSKTANEILEGSGTTVEEYIRMLDSGSTVKAPDLKGRSIYIKSTVKTEMVRVRNVIGVIEGNNPDQVIVLGAHYDHLGTGNGYIWNGADDNGSGTVAVMTVAKAIMETGIKPEKTLIIALWSAEEMGLLGSKYYVDNLDYPLKNLRLNVNFDMISRYVSETEQKKVNMIYTESYPLFRTITEQNLKNLGIDLEVSYQPSNDPPGGSDHRSFVAAGIPVMRFKPGHREQYHTPEDEITTVNWDIMEKIIKISFANIWYLSNNDW